MSSVDLSRFDNSWYRPGRSFLVQLLWFFVGLPMLRSSLIPSSGLRCRLLRTFGAKIGTGVVIKPGVRVKYPWHLTVGDHSWIGEDAWIDNLAAVRIGSNACISQGAYLCTGNHDWTDPAFALRIGEITVGDGSWVAAKSIVLPGVAINEGAILSAGAVASRSLPAWTVWSGNPAQQLKSRTCR